MYEKSIVGGVLAILKSPSSVAGASRKRSEVSVTTVLPPGRAGGYETGSADENSRLTTNDASGPRHRGRRESKRMAKVMHTVRREGDEAESDQPSFTRAGLAALDEPITRATRGVSSGNR